MLQGDRLPAARTSASPSLTCNMNAGVMLHDTSPCKTLVFVTPATDFCLVLDGSSVAAVAAAAAVACLRPMAARPRPAISIAESSRAPVVRQYGFVVTRLTDSGSQLANDTQYATEHKLCCCSTQQLDVSMLLHRAGRMRAGASRSSLPFGCSHELCSGVRMGLSMLRAMPPAPSPPALCWWPWRGAFVLAEPVVGGKGPPSSMLQGEREHVCGGFHETNAATKLLCPAVRWLHQMYQAEALVLCPAGSVSKRHISNKHLARQMPACSPEMAWLQG
jgi:hypothetical protein